MEYPKRNLRIVAEANDDYDNPTTWSIEMCGGDKKHYIWICKYDDKEYIVEDSVGNNLADGKVYKTLNGAKKMAEAIAWRQEETGFFTD